MLGLLNKIKKELTDYPVFNLEVARDKSSPRFKVHDRTSKYIGEFVAYNSGKLKHGRNTALHTFEGTLEYDDHHIHLPKGAILKKGAMFDLSRDHVGPAIKERFTSQHFTLQGFYSDIGPMEDSEKEEKLIDYIKEFNREFEFNSIATNERTRIKLLENVYRRNVSDQ